VCAYSHLCTDRHPPLLECEIRGSIPDGAFRDAIREALSSSTTDPVSHLPLIDLPDMLRFKRYALDLTFPKVDDEPSERWMRSLIWPEVYSARVERFRRSLATLRATRDRFEWIEGDGLAVLLSVLCGTHASQLDHAAAVSSSTARASVFVHSFSFYQLTNAMKERVESICCEASRSRDIYRISYDLEGAFEATTSTDAFGVLHILEYHNGERVSNRLVARADNHGQWIEFL